MPTLSAAAPGKIILFGEHAVVYGQPALAAPVLKVRAKAFVSAAPRAEPGTILIHAPDIGLESLLSELEVDHPLAQALWRVFSFLGITKPPAFSVRIRSTIPLASGLGSGAAVSVAIIKAVSGFLGHPLVREDVSAIAYEIEKKYHGTPSGIDNSVIAFEKPVYFVKGQPVQTLDVPKPFTIVIGDTGVASPTALAVGDVRRSFEQEPLHFQAMFEKVGRISLKARNLIETGEPMQLGSLMDENHACLQEIGVSSPELDLLVTAARQAGALGAKLSGGGRGGNMIALVEANQAQSVSQALLESGARQVIITRVANPEADDGS